MAMCNSIYDVHERAVKTILLMTPGFVEVILLDPVENRSAVPRHIRHNRAYRCGEIVFTISALALRCHHGRSLRTNAARSTRSWTRNRDRPAATATNASSGTTLVQPAGTEVRCPWPSR